MVQAKKALYVLLITITFHPISALEGWLWTQESPWLYSSEDENWIYIKHVPEIYSFKTEKWSKSNFELNELGWIWTSYYPIVYCYKLGGWLFFNEKSEITYAYSSWNNSWDKLKDYEHDWYTQYKNWSKNSYKYGGMNILENIFL